MLKKSVVLPLLALLMIQSVAYPETSCDHPGKRTLVFELRAPGGKVTPVDIQRQATNFLGSGVPFVVVKITASGDGNEDFPSEVGISTPAFSLSYSHPPSSRRDDTYVEIAMVCENGPTDFVAKTGGAWPEPLAWAGDVRLSSHAPNSLNHATVIVSSAHTGGKVEVVVVPLNGAPNPPSGVNAPPSPSPPASL